MSNHPKPMKCKMCVTACLAGLSVICTLPIVHAQNDQSRRDYTSPGLILNTGGRTGACDVLTFTRDGQHLLATGDDKVVRNWQFANGGLRPSKLPTLRWKTWQEARGQIYAMALSPDKDNRFVAIGGRGVKNSQLAVVDRFTGRISFAMWQLDKKQRGTIWAIAFAPSGKQVVYGSDDGTVWVWDLTGKRDEQARLLGTHAKHGDAVNKIRLVTYLDDNNVASVDEFGQVMQWTMAAGKPAAGHELFRFVGKEPLARVALSPDKKWLAAAVEGPFVRLHLFPENRLTIPAIKLPPGHYPQRLAFDKAGKRLAVAVRVVDQDGARFFRELRPLIYVYDIAGGNPKQVRRLSAEYRVEGLSFHPNGDYLAVAGGDNHEVSLWDLRQKKAVLVSRVRGSGSCLWGIALDARNPTIIGFQEKRDPQLPHPNRRGQGPWRVFDVKKRQWLSHDQFQATRAVNEWEGWRVLTTHAGVRDAAIWWVRSPGGDVWQLEHDAKRNGFPQCYTFLPPTSTKGLRLAVGHYWGVSLFQLPPAGRLVVSRKNNKVPLLLPSRLLTGHEGAVMALAASKDQKIMVTASRDQTIAGWNLDDWPAHPDLGARFVQRGDKLLVDAVDAGSPAWEMGLKKGDEILLLVIARQQVVFNRSGKYTANMGTARQAATALRNPVAGKELFMAWKRPGENKLIEQLTTLRQRPVWKFFATHDNEWVLWRWRDYVYDASTNGDFHIGFQENGPTLHDTPKFYRAEQFRNMLHAPAKMQNLFTQGKLVRLPDIAPPKNIVIKPHVKPILSSGSLIYRVDKNDLTVTLSAQPRGTRPNDKIVRAALWINDHQFRTWPIKTPAFLQKITIPRDVLRRGTNELLLQCYNHGNVRGESEALQVDLQRPIKVPTLYGIIVGVGDYRQSSPRQPDLKASADAQALSKLLLAQKGPGYGDVKILPPLLDHAVTPENVLKQIQSLKGIAGPDDVLVLHIGGHGARPTDLKQGLNIQMGAVKRALQQTSTPDKKLNSRLRALRAATQKLQLQSVHGFFFCCANFNLERLRETTLNFDDLYEALVALPCHKVILLDTCHSGDVEQYGVKNNPIRTLTPDGMGPIIFAACQPGQSAWEHGMIDPHMFGVFAAALRKTMQEDFANADRDKNRVLDARELYDNTRRQVRATMDLLGQQQVPIAFLPRMEADLKLIRR